ncbi:glutamine-hydrolyzing GMP synthase [Rathayibacter toxicus]|nr:glutamine-hydrolyzing GMP synthase [Rathayibacter toxicus]QWL34999.1 glutamine-hydrolyzing GMP synthase [Rathayibacter toxicus]QWL37130.1 glutamine-hydrolyzing GMP synthase [Rathayibacter toxicus]QWL39222.1 glutamine-hydrolyzing GMP synthase [Rathayibacter toxicus]QWL41308.1 glutamine-hydrolyzing GMP synthase [Rathayibacter toxicus]
MPLEPTPAQFPLIRNALGFYRVASVITGVMLLVLCLEMLLKYGLHVELFAFGQQGVLHFAPMYEVPGGEWKSSGTGVNVSTGVLIAHGWFYVVYLFSDFRLWSAMRWPFSRFVLIALGGVVPTLSFFLEARIAREVRQYLQQRSAVPEPIRRPLITWRPPINDQQSGTPIPHLSEQPVLVVDFGAQYAQLIARRVREAHVYSEIVPAHVTAAEIAAKSPAAIILSGGPASVYEQGTPQLDPAIFDLGVPVLGICYGFQIMAQALGGDVVNTGLREYGATTVTLVSDGGVLLGDQPSEQTVWMSHGDCVAAAPEGFEVLASTSSTPVAAFASDERRLYGVQWHPEVKHSEHGQTVLENFLHRAAGIPAEWNSAHVIDEQVALIRELVGSGRVICALSGGVDSAVAAALVHRAVGDQLTCVFVDHGLLRHDERRQVEEDYVAATGVRLVTVDAREQFLAALAGVSDPEQKRKIIGREFIRTFETTAESLVLEAQGAGESIDFLVQGTLYPDVVESGGGTGTANIKSHHNVGGLPEDLQFTLVEPLRTLFKDEVRAIGRELGLPETIVGRQPFPGPGLGIRIVGEVTQERLDLLRVADAIVRAELNAAGLDSKIWQCPVVLLADVRSVGVQGDGRTYGHPIVLRPVSSEDAMTADWTRLPYDLLARISTRITNEVSGVNRVVLDVTSKPPGTIEWE